MKIFSRRSAVKLIFALSSISRSGIAVAKDDSNPQSDKISTPSGTAVAYLLFEMSISKETMRALQDSFIGCKNRGYKNVCVLINSSGGGVSTAIAM